jgi:hypothetical protein
VSHLSYPVTCDLTWLTGHEKKIASCKEALDILKLVGTGLERLREEMDAFTWIDMELEDIETRVKALQDDHMLQMRIKGLTRDWEEAVHDHKSYIKAVGAIRA